MDVLVVVGKIYRFIRINGLGKTRDTVLIVMFTLSRHLIIEIYSVINFSKHGYYSNHKTIMI